MSEDVFEGAEMVLKVSFFLECGDLLFPPHRAIVSPPSALSASRMVQRDCVTARLQCDELLERSRDLRGAPEGNERERDLFISAFPFSGSSLCLLCRVTGERASERQRERERKKKRKEYGFI